jgi:D-alanyl-D-alanine carboxypeptidase
MMAKAYIKGVPGMVAVVTISHTRGGVEMLLVPEAAQAWERMCAAAEADGICLYANSAWRSYEHQQRLFDRWSSALSAWSRDPRPESEKGTRPPRPAEPGRSLHHNGICVDINRSHDPDGAGPRVPADIVAWLHDNAHRFGFVANVPGEGWHYEFRGIPG